MGKAFTLLAALGCLLEKSEEACQVRENVRKIVHRNREKEVPMSPATGWDYAYVALRSRSVSSAWKGAQPRD